MNLKNTLVALTLGAVATSVAFAQTTNTATNNCLGAPATCSVQAQTKLVAIMPEGLTITVPNQINFVLQPNTLQNAGDKDYDVQVSWTLGSYSYNDIYVQSFFQNDAQALVETLPTGTAAVIPAQNVLVQVNGFGQLLPVVEDGIASGSTGQTGVTLAKVDLNTTGMTGSMDFDNKIYINTQGLTLNTTSGADQYVGYIYAMATAF